MKGLTFYILQIAFTLSKQDSLTAFASKNIFKFVLKDLLRAFLGAFSRSFSACTSLTH